MWSQLALVNVKQIAGLLMSHKSVLPLYTVDLPKSGEEGLTSLTGSIGSSL